MEDPSNNLLNGCYQKIQQLGQGAYGTVYLYRRVIQKKKNVFNDFFFQRPVRSGQYFALKKYHSQSTKDRQGINFSALRQINMLLSLCHKNIASCHQVVHKKSSKGGQNQHYHHQIYAVLDFYLQVSQILTIPTIVRSTQQKIMICYQILKGLQFLHTNYVIHRDLKPENVFVSRQGEVKISDFGFAKDFGSPNAKYTANTCTKQYRAPQLFFATHYYTEKTDIWSYGCVLAYIFTNKTIFYSNSQNDIQVLARIFRLRGTPNQKNWPNYDKFPDFLRFEDTQQKDLQKQLQIPTPVAKIIDSCLQLNPVLRPSATQLLKSQFFINVKQENLKTQKYFDNKLNEIIRKNTRNAKSAMKQQEIDI